MTNSPAALPAFALEAVIEHDARAINGDDFVDPMIDLFDLRKSQLIADDFVTWAESFDLCAIHECDADICRDDELDCPAAHYGDEGYDEADNA